MTGSTPASMPAKIRAGMASITLSPDRASTRAITSCQPLSGSGSQVTALRSSPRRGGGGTARRCRHQSGHRHRRRIRGRVRVTASVASNASGHSCGMAVLQRESRNGPASASCAPDSYQDLYRRGRCLADTDLMTSWEPMDSAIGTAASRSAASRSWSISGRSRSSAAIRGRFRASRPLPRKSR